MGENLKHLQQLEVLDLSSNLIDTLDVEELPTSINCLNLRGNPCAEKPGYKERLLAHLADLAYLDGQVLDTVELSRGDLQLMDSVRAVASTSSSSATLGSAAEAGEVTLSGGEQGLGAYYRRDELQTGFAASIQGKLQAYNI